MTPTFVVVLRLGEQRARARELMNAHNEWIQRGFRDRVFLLVGSLQPGPGGVVLAHGASRADLLDRVRADPFVAEGVATAEILEVAPSKADARLAFVLSKP